MRFAILLDGSWVLNRLRKLLSRRPEAADIRAYCDNLGKHPDLVGATLLRIHFYDGEPAEGSVRHPMGGNLRLEATPQYAHRQLLFEELRHSRDFALRMGTVAVRGWRVRERAVADLASSGRSIGRDDLELNLEQKGVDLRVGLDIARLALGRVVDVIVVATGDSDFIPAFKFARREGLRVYLDTLDGQINDELAVHADLVLRTAVPLDPPAELRAPAGVPLNVRSRATPPSVECD